MAKKKQRAQKRPRRAIARFRFAPNPRANPGADVQEAASRATARMREDLGKTLGHERWSMRSNVIEMDPPRDPFFSVVVEIDHCPDDPRDFNRCEKRVLAAWRSSGLDEYLIFDGTDFGPLGSGLKPGQCSQRGYHFYERKPGEGDSPPPQSAVDWERDCIERSLTKARKKKPKKKAKRNPSMASIMSRALR